MLWLGGVGHAPHPDALGLRLHGGAQRKAVILSRQTVHQIGLPCTVQSNNSHDYHWLRNLLQNLYGFLVHQQLFIVVFHKTNGSHLWLGHSNLPT